MKNMKRVICWIITVMLIINMLPLAALAADNAGQVENDQAATTTTPNVTFKVGKVSVALDNQTATVPIRIENNTGFIAAELDIDFGEGENGHKGLELTKVELGGDFTPGGDGLDENDGLNGLRMTPNTKDGQVELDSDKNITVKNGDLLILTFNIKNPNQIGNYTIDVDVEWLYQATGTGYKPLTSSVEAGSVTVGAVQVGNNFYASIADALAAANAGDIITFLQDITEDVTINKSVTIDGAGKTYTGNMTLKNNATITIKNVNFDGKGDNGYAIETRGANYLTIDNCTAKGYYGFVQLASATDITTVKNVTVSNMGYGIKVDYSNAVVLENVKLDCTVAGVLNSNYGKKIITIKNSDISILGTWTRNNTIKTTYVFEGNNTVGKFIIDAAIDNFQLALGATLTAPNDITATATEEGYSVKYADGKYFVKADMVAIGEETYASLADALAAANAGDTITFLQDITEDVTITKAVTIDGAGKTYTGAMTLKADTTIKNVNFDGKGYNGYAITTRGANYLTIEDCTAKNYGYGFVQLASGTALTTVKNVTVSNMNYGVKVDYSNAVVLENVDITASVAAVLNSNFGEKTITIKNSKLNILGTWDRFEKTGVNYVTTYVFEGENTVGEFKTVAAIDTFKLAVGATLTAPNTITATATEAGYSVKYEAGKYIVKADMVKIGEKTYASLAEALTAANAGDTIEFLQDITEDVTITKAVTIDGAGKTYTGAMTLKADTTIKNVNFDGKGYNGYAITTRGANYLTIEDCTAKNYGYGFVQLASATVLTTVKNVTVSNMNYGIKVDYSNAVVLENVDITASVAALYNSNYGEKTITIKDSELNIIKTWKRNDTTKTTYVFEGDNTVGEFQTNAELDSFKLADKNSTLTAPQGLNVTTDVVDHAVAYKDGKYFVKEIIQRGTWGGIDWTFYIESGTLVIAPTAGEPVPDKNAPTKRTYEVGEWRETVVYNKNGGAASIGGAPYDMKAVKKLIIEEGVTKIGSFTCQFPNLTGEVIIPSTVTYIGQEAFHKTPITKLTFAAGGTEGLCIANGAFKKTLIEEVSFPGDREYIHIHHWAFGGSSNLKYAYIPANVTKSWGGEHVDYFDNFNSQTNPSWTQSGSIFTGCTNMQTITFETEAVRNLFFANNRQGTAEDYIVAYAGLVAYNTFEEALEAALASGETLGLVKSVTVKDTIVIPAGKTLTINLNGKTLSQSKACTASYEMILNKGNLTITGNGKISFTDTSAGDPNFGWGSYTIRNEGTLVVENGTIEHKGAQAFATHMICAIFQYSGSTTINGGTISTPNYRSIRLWKGDMTINGGTFDGQVWVQAVDNSAELTINGGTFEPNGQDASSVFVSNATYDVEFAVTDGTFNGKIGANNVTKLAGAIIGGKFNEGAKNGTAVALLGNCKIFDENAENGYYGLIEGLKGSGTEADPYIINNVDELIFFRNSVNAGETKYNAPGVYVALGANIDLIGINWVGIGSATAEHGFMGNFDGKGFKIMNLTITNPALDSDGYAYAGLFAVTEGIDKDHQNIIKNLIIENVTISTTGHIVAAAIAYPYYTIVDNVTVCGNIAIEGGDYTSGVLAYTRRCVNASNLTISGNAGSYITGAQVVGGVISDIQMNGGLTANYSNFSASGLTITGTKMVGGISGIIATQTLNGATVKNVTLESGDTRVGIVSGSLGGTSTISNVIAENVTGATVIVGGTYDDGKAVEAKIGDTYYATFAKAYAAANAGETITLLADVTADEVIEIGKSITINGDGHKVTSSATRVFRVTTANVEVTLNEVNMVSTAARIGTNDVRGISIDPALTNIELTLNNCSVDFTAASANDWTYAVNVSGNGTGHTVTVNGGTYEGANVINVHGANNTVIVKNATLTSLYPNNDVYYGACIWVLQNQGSSVEATGNTFNGANAIAFNLGTGTALTESNNIDNTTRVVAKIDGTYYTSLADALAAVGAGDVVIELVANATLDYNARDAYGTADTTSITINGNGKTLTLNQKNSDWASIGLANADAKLVLNNMTIEKTGYGDTSGAWNTHAIIFSCNVEMNNVTVNNSVAVQNGATLDNVTINEANGYYGLWINGNDQTVTVNGGAINATNGGRGIKIADEYVGAPAEVTLNVTGTKFNTAKKAAVLVSSKAGANITASNVDITNVAADKVNFVWVDEDWAANYGKVTVTGASVTQEELGTFKAAIVDGDKVVGYYKTLEAAIEAADEGAEIALLTPYVVKAGKTLEINKNVTISRTHGSEYAMIHVENGATLIINKGTITYAAGGNNTGAAIWVEGALVQNGGTIEVTGTWDFGFAVDVRPNAWGTAHTTGASFIMNDGTIKSTDTAVRVASNSSDAYPELGVTFTMNGGSIESTWDAIFVQHLYNSVLDVNVKAGTVKGANSALRIYGNAGSDIDIIVEGGNFIGEIKVADAYKDSDAIALSGGTYTQDVAKYCAYGFRAEKVAENTWKVVEVALGDVNGDGSVDVADVVLLRRYIVGLVDETKINVFAANVYSEDNDINVLDVVLIRQIIVRQPTTEENN